MPPEDYREIKLSAGDESINEPDETLWLTCCLLIARYLLQSSKIPVFDYFEIVEQHPSPNRSTQFNSEISVPNIGELPIKVFLDTLRLSMETMIWCSKKAISDQNRDEIFNRLNDDAISKVSRIMGGGKSTFHVLKSAYEMSIPFHHMGAGVYRLGLGAKSKLLDRSTTEYDSAIGARVTNNKASTATILRCHGLPGAYHFLAKSKERAIEIASKLSWPIVIKPVDADRGEGVTVDVSDELQLVKAFDTALDCSKLKQVLVEKQVKGVCHRVFVVNGKLLYAVKRLPMSVEGDGVRTVEKLLNDELDAQKKLPPWERSGIQPLDDLTKDALSRNGYQLDSIPAPGHLVPLRRIESTEWGGVDIDVTHVMHPENVIAAVRGARAFGLYVAGVDIISEDISVPWYENDSIINEVNFSPLLGGGEISRSKIPQYLGEYLGQNATIGTEVYLGGESIWGLADSRWESLGRDGLNVHIIKSGKTYSSRFGEIHSRSKNLNEIILAAINNDTVDHLIIVVDPNETSVQGFPLPWVTKLFVDSDVDAGNIGLGFFSKIALDVEDCK